MPRGSQGRHCEPTGRANARPMTGSAKQSISPLAESMDCVVAALLAMTGLDCEFTSRHPPKSLQVALAGGVDDAGRQRRGRGVAVPAAGAALGVEIVAQRLLVEARLRLAGLVDVHCPESRTVGGHHLVDQDDAAVA